MGTFMLGKFNTLAYFCLLTCLGSKFLTYFLSFEFHIVYVFAKSLSKKLNQSDKVEIGTWTDMVDNNRQEVQIEIKLDISI